MMKRYGLRAGATIAVAALLAACGGDKAAQANNDAAEVEANAGAAEALAGGEAITPAAAADGAPSADFMVGKWSAIDESCADTLEFRNDGKVTTPIGDANWTMAGDKLTIDYGDGAKPTTTTIKPLSGERIEVTTESGRTETQKRC